MNKKLFHLMAEDIRHRIYIFALSALIFFFVYPVATVNMLGSATVSDEINAVRIKNLLEEFEDAYSTQFITFILVSLCFVAAINGFIFLLKQNRSDFIHSLPVDRKKIFIAVNLDNFIMILTPQIAFAMISASIVSTRCASMRPVNVILTSVLWNAPCMLVCYSVAVLSMMLAGNMFTVLALNAFFNFYAPCFLFLINGLFSYFETYYEKGDFIQEELIGFTSPFIFSLLEKPEDLPGLLLGAAVMVIIGLVFLSIARILYLRRDLEQAGRALVFKRTELPLKLLICIPMGIVGAMMGRSIIGRYRGFAWSVFFMVCAVVICHCIMEIIYNSDFRKLFNNIIHMLVILGLAAFVYFAFSLDIFGYDSYIPGPERIKGVGVYCEALDSNIDKLNMKLKLSDEIPGSGRQHVLERDSFNEAELLDKMQLTDTSAAFELAKTGIAQTDRKNVISKKQDGRRVEVCISWHMKNGSHIRRRYSIRLRDNMDVLAKIYDDSGFRKAVYPVLSMDASDLAAVNFEDGVGTVHLDGADRAGLEKLLEVYKAEFGTMTVEKRMHEAPVYCIKFKDKELQGILDVCRIKDINVSSYYTDMGYYPVYPSFAGTINALRECGADPDRATKASHFEQVELTHGANHPMTFYDNGRMQQVLNAGIPDLRYDDDFCPRFRSISVEATLNTANFLYDGPDYSSDPEFSESSYIHKMRMSLKTEGTPEFIRRDYGLDFITGNVMGWGMED